jgi:hypothetical protein
MRSGDRTDQAYEPKHVQGIKEECFPEVRLSVRVIHKDQCYAVSYGILNYKVRSNVMVDGRAYVDLVMFTEND